MKKDLQGLLPFEEQLFPLLIEDLAPASTETEPEPPTVYRTAKPPYTVARPEYQQELGKAIYAEQSLYQEPEIFHLEPIGYQRKAQKKDTRRTLQKQLKDMISPAGCRGYSPWMKLQALLNARSFAHENNLEWLPEYQADLGAAARQQLFEVIGYHERLETPQWGAWNSQPISPLLIQSSKRVGDASQVIKPLSQTGQ